MLEAKAVSRSFGPVEVLHEIGGAPLFAHALASASELEGYRVIVVGHGGISWEITRQLVKNLPAMVAPHWVGTKTQPIGLRDVVRYLVGVLDNDEAKGRIFEVGGPEVQWTWGLAHVWLGTVALLDGDADEAVRLANDSEYGLCGSVFGRDLDRAESVARRLEVGAVTVNDAVVNYTALELPMGGAKPASGIGRRHGKDGITKYCRQQSLLVSRWHLRRDLHTYPYRARRTRVLGRLLAVLNRGLPE